MFFKHSSFNLIKENSNDRILIVDLFLEIFGGAPRFENWDRGTAEKFLFSSILGDGDIWYLEDVNGCHAFCFGGSVQPAIVDIIPEISSFESNAAYLAAIGVKENKRNNGLGSNLLKVWIHNAFRKQATEIVIRTLESSELMSSLLSGLGFRVVSRRHSEIGGVTDLHVCWSLKRHTYTSKVKQFFYEPIGSEFRAKQYCVPGFTRCDSEILLKSSLGRDLVLHLLDVREIE